MASIREYKSTQIEYKRREQAEKRELRLYHPPGATVLTNGGGGWCFLECLAQSMNDLKPDGTVDRMKLQPLREQVVDIYAGIGKRKIEEEAAAKIQEGVDPGIVAKESDRAFEKLDQDCHEQREPGAFMGDSRDWSCNSNDAMYESFALVSGTNLKVVWLVYDDEQPFRTEQVFQCPGATKTSHVIFHANDPNRKTRPLANHVVFVKYPVCVFVELLS